VLFIFNGLGPFGGLGASLSGGKDLNGDGIPDVLLGAPGENLGNIGSGGLAKALSVVGIPSGSSVFGSGCPGTGGIPPKISTFGGPPSVGNSVFGFAVSKARGGSVSLLFVGTAAIPSGIQVGGCNVYLRGVIFPIGSPISLAGAAGLGGAGYHLLGQPIPPVSALVGIVVPFQWAVLDPLGPNGLFTTSDALALASP
jgi:hypothetical protein